MIKTSRILILNYEFPPLGGGAAHATYNILKEFSKRKNLEVDLVTSSSNNYKIEKFANNINIHYLDINKKGNIHYQSQKDLLTYAWKAYFFSKKLKKKKQYDLIHAFFGIPCGFIAMLLKLPYIVSLRGSDVPFYNERFKLLDKIIFKNLSKYFIWKKADAVITNSEGLKKLAHKTNPSQTIDVIYNGINIDKFYPDKSKLNKNFTILYNARLIERKGIRYLIDAFIDFNKQHPETELFIVSSGNLEQEMKSKAKKAMLKNKIRFLGAFDPKTNRIPEIYRQCHVFALPSLNEGMSNSLLEALATGMPIIATDTGGTKELVNNNNGIIIKKKNSQDILEALSFLYNNRELTSKMSESSLTRAQQMKWENTANQYHQIYKKFIKN